MASFNIDPLGQTSVALPAGFSVSAGSDMSSAGTTFDTTRFSFDGTGYNNYSMQPNISVLPSYRRNVLLNEK